MTALWNATVDGVEKAVKFEGRLGRASFWYFQLAILLFTTAGTLLDFLFFFGNSEILGNLCSLIALLPSVSSGVRRLHDSDRSGKWMFIILLPIIGFLVLIYMWIDPGTNGLNRYGRKPSDA